MMIKNTYIQLLKEINIYHSIIIIDTVRMKPTESGYLVVCEDGITRKFSIKNFYTIEQWRENQLNGIDITENP